MIYFLIFRCVFEHFWFTDACPNNVPFTTVRWAYSYTSCFHRIDYRIVNMRRIMNLKTKSHIFIIFLVIWFSYYFDIFYMPGLAWGFLGQALDVHGVSLGSACLALEFLSNSSQSLYPPPLQAMNHIMEYSQLAGYIVILWWHGQSQLKLDMSMPDHKNSQIHLWMVAWWGLLTCRRRLFFVKNDVPEIFMTCDSPAEVFFKWRRRFFSRQTVTHKWLWLYLWWERNYGSPSSERVWIHKWLRLWL